jgi:hypothetical protein
MVDMAVLLLSAGARVRIGTYMLDFLIRRLLQSGKDHAMEKRGKLLATPACVRGWRLAL